MNARRVPSRLAEPLVSGVNALGEQTPVCLPAVPATSTTPVVSPAPPPAPAPHGKSHSKHEKHHHPHKEKHH